MDHSDKENKSLLAFNKIWQEQFAKDSLLVFSTGRSHELYLKLRVSDLHFYSLDSGIAMAYKPGKKLNDKSMQLLREDEQAVMSIFTRKNISVHIDCGNPQLRPGFPHHLTA